jgi:hypothetical protein
MPTSAWAAAAAAAVDVALLPEPSGRLRRVEMSSVTFGGGEMGLASVRGYEGKTSSLLRDVK